MDEKVGNVETFSDILEALRVGDVGFADLQTKRLEPGCLGTIADEAPDARSRPGQGLGEPATNEARCARYECVGRDALRLPASARFTRGHSLIAPFNEAEADIGRAPQRRALSELDGVDAIEATQVVDELRPLEVRVDDLSEVGGRERLVDPAQGFDDLNLHRMEKLNRQRRPPGIADLTTVAVAIFSRSHRPASLDPFDYLDHFAL